MSQVLTPVRALSADDSWQRLLAVATATGVVTGQGLTTTVAAVFTHAVNLYVDGEQFTLLTIDGRPAPGALVTSRADFEDILVGSPVLIGGARISLAPPTTGTSGRDGAAGRGVDIDLGDLVFFSSQVHRIRRQSPLAAFEVGEPPYSIDPPGPRRAQEIGQIVARIATPGSFYPRENATPFERALGAKLDGSRTEFQNALVLLDPSRLQKAIAGLVGLGIGLTPSGDDYLVGALALLSQHPDTHEACGLVCAALYDLLTGPTGTELTTEVSRHFLIAATQHRFHVDLANAALAALNGAANIEAAFAATAAIGATSGSDALTGIQDAFLYCTPTSF